MTMLRYLLVIIALVMVFKRCAANGNQPKFTPEQEQELQALTMRLLEHVSLPCRQDLTEALTHNREVSTDECKQEINEFMRNNPLSAGMPQQKQEPTQEVETYDTGLVDDMGNPIYSEVKRAKRSTPSNSWISPTTAIIMLVTLALGSVIAYMVHYHSTHHEDESKKPKKLSKKKEEKLRAKGKL